ncbi:siderophore-interacting protein [Amylibacter marinus]|uniref:Siderophore-interacting protein n=1 Tax=Amylibacter marinus TaxID=1475483 RepID=A0ABQ5VX05_9RHOB|nr:siderophore-interacting protein [Amylibacter marinus]GLQ35827.1 siderophore-interacting protein [Amylibacter marinus]
MPQQSTPKKRPSPKILTVKRAWHLTPNMIRVTFQGPELADIPTGREGANCKIILPEQGENRAEFHARINSGPLPLRRTYTVRHHRPETQELDIDFVDHGTAGPASAWANRARAGDFLGFSGPSSVKIAAYNADWYLVAADPSALPVAAATLEAMPRDAIGTAVFEITSPEDKQDIDAPAGIDIHWLVHPDPSQPSSAQEDFIRAMDWREGRVQTCIAGESGVIKSLRGFLAQEMNVPRADTYISGYWKIGLIEDQHQQMKRAEAG